MASPQFSAMSAAKGLAFRRPFVLGVANQVMSFCGIGICDPFLINIVTALEPFRYATGLFQWCLVPTVDPKTGLATAANIDGDDLELCLQEIDLLRVGIGEPIPGGWWIQTLSDTDLFRGGAPICEGYMFLATGLTFNALDAFQRGVSCTSPDAPKFYSAWLNESENGNCYSFLMQKYHINYTAIEFSFGDEGCRYRLGVGGFWPVWGDPAGSCTVRNGLISTPGMYLPFTTAVCLGARDDCNQLTIILTVGQKGRIQSRPNSITVAGSTPQTNMTINQCNDGTVYVPVRVVVVGYIVCVPFANTCGFPVPTGDDLQFWQTRYGLVTPTPDLTGGVPAGVAPGVLQGAPALPSPMQPMAVGVAGTAPVGQPTAPGGWPYR